MQLLDRQDSPALPTRCAVVRHGGHYALRATGPIAAGSRILVFTGEITSTPTRFSVQVGAHEHLDLPATCTHEEILDRHPWRFLNHSCAPNTRVQGLDLVALTDIVAWEQLCFDYTTTEATMAEPFDCACGAPNCLGRVSGFAGLDAGERAERAAHLAPWLVKSTSQGSV